MIVKNFYCKKCGNLVGQYHIKDGLSGIGLSLSSYCHNYCSICGEKVDKEKFQRDLDFDINKCQLRKENDSKLQELLESMINKGVQKND